MTENTRKQGEKITFNLSEKVVGLSGEINGVVGPIVIVKLDAPLNDYPFTHIYIVDAQIVV